MDLVGFIREIFFGIDAIVYWLVETAYMLFYRIAEVDLTSLGATDTISSLFDRIQQLATIVMLFYLLFVALQWIVDPSKSYDDKSKLAGGKIAKRIVISVCLLLSFNLIFDFLGVVQHEIIAGDTINKIIVGVEGSGEESPDASASQLAATVLGSFLRLDGRIGNGCEAYFSGNPGYAIFEKEGDRMNFEILNEKDCMREKDGENYSIDYKWIISTVAGIYLGYLLILFCIDIGTRVVELAFLQIIAPIPIMSYVVQEEAFNKWKDRLITTYLSLFLRMAVFSFAALLIRIVMESGIIDTADWGVWILLFIILGIFTFMKEAPKLLKDVFGLKGDAISFSGKDRPVLGAAVGLGMIAAKAAAPAVGGAAKFAGGALQTAGAGLGHLMLGTNSANPNAVQRGNNIIRTAANIAQGTGSVIGGVSGFARGLMANNFNVSQAAANARSTATSTGMAMRGNMVRGITNFESTPAMSHLGRGATSLVRGVGASLSAVPGSATRAGSVVRGFFGNGNR